MYCTNCGRELAEGAKFCSQCGTPVNVPSEAAPAPSVVEDTAKTEAVDTKPDLDIAEAQEATSEVSTGTEKNVSEIAAEFRAPSFDEFRWNVSDYPDRNSAGKTEDVDFNWNASPASVEETLKTDFVPEQPKNTEHPETFEAKPQEEVLKGENLESAIFGEEKENLDPENMSAAERIDKFYTFNRKNEEFQQLLDKEYNKVKSGNAIGNEISQAEARASERFESRPLNATMEEFLESEGVVKPYQPKAFESDVLQRIEAQEAEKEAKRLEEEARLAAIEEARKEAEAKKLAEEQERIAEEAKIRAEEEAKTRAAEEAARLEEIAKAKAAEEARLAEEAKIRAEEEAKRRAEEEARRKAEEEARQKAEAEARVKAEEEARIKAEADLRAAREAAKIRAQQEARLAAKEEEKFRAEQERRRLAEIEAQKKLEEERQKIVRQANQAVAEEEARKVLEQTARMREEEAAKIKAAVAGLRAGSINDKMSEKTPPVRKEVEEAHRATKTQIDEMAKARDLFFAELEEEKAESAPVTGRDTMLTNDLSRTRTVDKKAIMEGLAGDTTVVSKKAIEEGLSKTQQTEDDEFFNSLNAAAVAGAASTAAAGQPMDFEEESLDILDEMDTESVEELRFEEVNDIENLDNIESLQNLNDIRDFDNADSFESLDDLIIQDEEPVLDNTQMFSHEDFAETSAINAASGLQDTVVMEKSGQLDAFAADDFDNYGREEAQNYINKQEQMEQTRDYSGELGSNPSMNNTAMDEFYSDDFYDDESQLSKKELKQREKEQRRLEKQRVKAEKARKKNELAEVGNEEDYDVQYDEKSGGKGRVALKVILVILIIILAVEIVGMGIKFIAPQSKAAEFIDSQLNKVIQLVTGDDTEYSVIAAQVRTEPIEDKTDLINAQQKKNKDKNIKSIVYSAELNYDQERDGKISDLVLSQPMTQVEWGRNEENYPVYFDEQVVGKIIAFESQKYNLMNKGDEQVLQMIDQESELYSQISALKGKKSDGDFKKLEIGEIRQAGSNYYIWVSETIGDNKIQRVYSMYPEKEFVLKLAACYDV